MSDVGQLYEISQILTGKNIWMVVYCGQLLVKEVWKPQIPGLTLQKTFICTILRIMGTNSVHLLETCGDFSKHHKWSCGIKWNVCHFARTWAYLTFTNCWTSLGTNMSQDLTNEHPHLSPTTRLVYQWDIEIPRSEEDFWLWFPLTIAIQIHSLRICHLVVSDMAGKSHLVDLINDDFPTQSSVLTCSNSGFVPDVPMMFPLKPPFNKRMSHRDLASSLRDTLSAPWATSEKRACVSNVEHPIRQWFNNFELIL